MKDKIVAILIIVVAAGILIGVFIYDMTPPELKNPAYTIGVLIEIESGSGTTGDDAIIEYSVNGKRYKAYTMANTGMIVGDKYKVKYDKSNPEKHLLLETKPVFLETEKTGIVVGTVNHLIKIGKNKLGFIYEVNGIEYERFQLYNKNKFTPEKGEQYQVKYWRQNPQRAIIQLDQPK